MRAAPKNSTANFLEQKLQNGTNNVIDHHNQFPYEQLQGSWEEGHGKRINVDDHEGFGVRPKISENNNGDDVHHHEDVEDDDDDHNATPPLTFIEKWLLEETSTTGGQMEEMSQLMELSNML